ncbi:UDP-N-acetylmuramoyl-L-alanine--D-glutamate ligase [Leptolyngbyaceae cyanobacterium CCMR0082]|uniref:UDP-N-acetylmuramoylalanine--D-glutamate ligase n=2 Tax=Adonisia turfae TaxID=2950184 RepID=A0A6M0SDY3_9CYAN|nr:UDP-N-acetylmuramoyl-L-alanine--D-glutamate ligase [Adonisia turfae]MDV3347998.1 UDP-N-acetylmuramoyl-L-alanine--D-glutamate ligase [Leptothoe sp. LEGE 181152]NEZ55491.1 UDP-N-acetylmuramoyl-L-alanine--D-glutamate ligase [Adonisia turfae CCMR0081]NEZ66699.1 UDP-N-acetylmuramoyl-L-alanine--D-glutamate ligase [Adonisia turfae CCMR0082]
MESAKLGQSESQPIAYVIGLGLSGVAAARLLKKEGWHVVVSDRNNGERQLAQQETLTAEGIDVKLGHTFPGDDPMDLAVASPGVPWDAPGLMKARENGIITIGEMELAWRALSHLPWLGITGTNGKTTTTELVAAIFKAAKLNAPACGNIGYAACQVALDPEPDWVLAELSSYQIEASIGPKPKIGVWTTFTPDHLSRHKTIENYYGIKASLLERSEKRVLNGDDPCLRETLANRWENSYWTSIDGPNAIMPLVPSTYIDQQGWVIHEDERILAVDSLKMVGRHNLQNLLMAVAAAKLADIPNEAIASAIANFSGVAHRLEYITTWEGIDFINDSKATNYDAAEVGLSSVNSPVILIAGGAAKAGDDTAWLERIQEKVVQVLLIGDAAPQFSQRLIDVGYGRFEDVGTMENAVQRSKEIALGLKAKVVLLSPACASFDQYTNFEARGDDFRNQCERFLK